MSSVMDDYVELEDDNYCASLLILPTELLLMILTYLSIQDIISMQFVSQRIKDISETPSLWEKFVWPDYEPDHICVSKALKIHGEYVKQLFLPVHVTLASLLEMIQYCPMVKHLSLPRYTQLNLDHLEEIVHTMTHLEQLDVFNSSIIEHRYSHQREKRTEKLLKVTSASIKNLTLKFDWNTDIDYYASVEMIMFTLQSSVCNNSPLPSIINLFICNEASGNHYGLLEYCPASSYTIASIEICFYEIIRVPIDLYPSIPLMKFRFGPAAKRHLVKLSDQGILGLNKDILYLSDYDHYSKVRLSATPRCARYLDFVNYVKDEHYISNFDSVSDIDLSSVNVYPDHLEQLAIACSNLERLDLSSAQNCLQNMQVLHAIVNTCQNLQGLNLEEIPLESKESCLLLWELLSSIKKLSHLAIDLCMLIHINNNCYNAVDKDKLIGMLRNCKSLKALEVTKPFEQIFECECLNVNDLLLDHFPSLVYVRISLGLAQTECTKYAITNCRQLKYLYFDGDYYRRRVCTLDLDLLSSTSCYLQQIFVRLYVDLSAPSTHVLSAHGGLEKIILFVRSITTGAITTLISNSPNLMLLYIFTEPNAVRDENGDSVNQKDYKD